MSFLVEAFTILIHTQQYVYYIYICTLLARLTYQIFQFGLQIKTFRDTCCKCTDKTIKMCYTPTYLLLQQDVDNDDGYECSGGVGVPADDDDYYETKEEDDDNDGSGL